MSTRRLAAIGPGHFLVIAAVVVLAACGSKSPSSLNNTASGPMGTAQLVVTLDVSLSPLPVPMGAAKVHAPSLDVHALASALPPSSGFLQLTLTSVNGVALNGTGIFVELRPSQYGCSKVGGTLTCTVNLPVPAGTDTFSVQILAQSEAHAEGLLAKGTASGVIQPGQTSTLTLDLHPIVARFITNLVPNHLPATVPGTAVLSVRAVDYANHEILGTASYADPITLAPNSPNTHVTPSTTALTAPGQTITFSYDGQSVLPNFAADLYSQSAYHLSEVLFFDGAAGSISGASLYFWVYATAPNPLPAGVAPGVLWSRVYVYAAGASGPDKYVNSFLVPGGSGTGVGITSMAADKLGNVFIANATNVLVYPPGVTGVPTPISTLASGKLPTYVVINPSDGLSLYVAGSNGLQNGGGRKTYVFPYGTGWRPDAAATGAVIPQYESLYGDGRFYPYPRAANFGVPGVKVLGCFEWRNENGFTCLTANSRDTTITANQSDYPMVGFFKPYNLTRLFIDKSGRVLYPFVNIPPGEIYSDNSGPPYYPNAPATPFIRPVALYTLGGDWRTGATYAYNANNPFLPIDFDTDGYLYVADAGNSPPAGSGNSVFIYPPGSSGTNATSVRRVIGEPGAIFGCVSH